MVRRFNLEQSFSQDNFHMRLNWYSNRFIPNWIDIETNEIESDNRIKSRLFESEKKLI